MKIYTNGTGEITGFIQNDLLFQKYDNLEDSNEIEVSDEIVKDKALFNFSYANGELNILKEVEQKKQEAKLEELMLLNIRPMFLENLPDEQAATIPLCYEPWEIGKSYEVGDRCECDGKLWKCRQAHTSQENRKPSINTASLWEVIDVEHAGTLEDPIPYDQTMTVHNGKYYSENGIIYKCIRDSGQPLYAACSASVGNYFVVAQ